MTPSSRTGVVRSSRKTPDSVIELPPPSVIMTVPSRV